MSSVDLQPPGPPPPPVLVTTVDLGEKGSETLMIFNNDDPLQVARDFCAKHKLPGAVVEPLTAHILDNLAPTDTKADPVEEQRTDDSLELSQVEDVCAKPTDSLLKEVEEVTSRVNAELNAAAAAAVPPLSLSAVSADEDDGLHSDGSRQTRVPLTSRPSSANSSHGMTYYSGSKAILPSSVRTEEANMAPAVDRLYADHFRKQRMLEEQRRIRELQAQLATQRAYCTPVSRVLASHRSARGYTSYGERLYVEGRMDALKKEQAAKIAKETEAAEELAAATFRPEISKMAKALKALERSRPGSAPWKRLYTRSTTLKKEKRAEMIRLEQEEEELKECSFRPRIDSRSKALVQARREIGSDPWALDPQSDDFSEEIQFVEPSFNHPSAAGAGAGAGAVTTTTATTARQVGERLYRQGLYLKQRAQAKAQAWLPDEATFRPHLVTSSSLLSTNESCKVPLASGIDVADRLMQKGAEYAARRAAIKEAMQVPVDQKGRILFKPTTWKPRRSKFSVAGDIGDYLYSAAKKASAKASKAEEEAARKAKIDASTTHVNKLSDKMMERLKNERLRAIFNYLLGWPGGLVDAADQKSDTSLAGMIEQQLNLLGVIGDEQFMDTIDPEVRTDIEHAARLFLQQQSVVVGERAKALPPVSDNEENQPPAESSSSSWNSSNYEPEGYYGAYYPATDTPVTIDFDMFADLMHEVLNKTRGIARRYLMPLGSSSRKKWEEPSFMPDVAPKSKALAARLRPSGIPAHEILYQTAQEIKAKKEVARKELERASLAACSFKPKFIAAQLVKKGRALQLAGQQESEERDAVECSLKDDNCLREKETVNSVALEDGIDVIERQIRDAVARLNASGEALMSKMMMTSNMNEPVGGLGHTMKAALRALEEEKEEVDDEEKEEGKSAEKTNDLVQRLRMSLDINGPDDENNETEMETEPLNQQFEGQGEDEGSLIPALEELYIDVNVPSANSRVGPPSGKLATIAAAPLAF